MGQATSGYNVLGSQIMFYGGVGLMLALAVGALVFAYKLIPRTIKSRVCPVEDFMRAAKIAIYLPRDSDIIIKPDSKYFSELIGNFIADKKPPAGSVVYRGKLSLWVKGRRYAIEVSPEGWNFEGEEPGTRSLRNPARAMEIIDSIKEEHSKK